MKIFLVNNFYYPFQKGGAEEIVKISAMGLGDLGHSVFILSAHPSDNTKFYKEKNTIYLPSKYFEVIKMPKFFRFLWHVFEYFNLVKAITLIRLFKREKPDMVITHNLKGPFFILPHILTFLKITHIHILHDVQLLHPSGLVCLGDESKLDSFWAGFYQTINKCLFRKTSVVISPSKWLLDMHTARGFFKKTEKSIIPNPVKKQKATKNIHHEDKTYKFIFAGQLEKHKGLLLLLDAFNALPKDLDLELSIFGAGSLESKLIAFLKEDFRIKFEGRIEHNDLMQRISQSDCLILPSVCYENFPTVMCEAAALAKPVLASDFGGAGELLNKLGGVSFLAGNSLSLADKMIWLIKNPHQGEKIGALAYKRIDEFSISKYIDKLLCLAGFE